MADEDTDTRGLVKDSGCYATLLTLCTSTAAVSLLSPSSSAAVIKRHPRRQSRN